MASFLARSFCNFLALIIKHSAPVRTCRDGFLGLGVPWEAPWVVSLSELFYWVYVLVSKLGEVPTCLVSSISLLPNPFLLLAVVSRFSTSIASSLSILSTIHLAILSPL